MPYMEIWKTKEQTVLNAKSVRSKAGTSTASFRRPSGSDKPPPKPFAPATLPHLRPMTPSHQTLPPRNVSQKSQWIQYNENKSTAVSSDPFETQ
ncbi:hypothetical protein PENANT_c020G08875 [Penicillium antarcticum]|uniref:Uncharacterized protein n=1 Tax=Penicillium antarcticum TaxID=416450 RepID=A0A1V6Q0T8_9EURO|nr:hypothetical protein PENANT_c020G08875 [Penicillium antarcticum]